MYLKQLDAQLWNSGRVSMETMAMEGNCRLSGVSYAHFTSLNTSRCGPGSSVDIVTDYGLDGPGSNSGGDEIFRPSRPVLGPTQPPVKWVLGLYRG